MKKTVLTAMLIIVLLGAAPVWAVTFTTPVTITESDTAYDGQDIVVSGCAVTIDGVHSFASLTIQNSGTVTHSQGVPMNLTISGEVVVEAGSAIDVSGRGYAQGVGPGTGSTVGSSGSGAGYGGEGGWSRAGASPGVAYGSMVEPVDLGSGGGNSDMWELPGGPGGGVMKLVVSGTLTIDGVLSANGINGGVWDYYSQTQGGGGSGGSVWITAGVLAGSGSITANGGSSLGTYSGIYGGGGGGGRIALYYTSSSFAGILSAKGGTGNTNGGAGTIYRKGNSDAHGQLLVNNGGVIAGWTPISNYTPYDAVISDGAVVYTPGPVTLSGLAIHSGGYISHKDSIAMGVNLTVLGNATIDTGATVLLDGKGYGQQSGPGAGYEGGSGAGYGGEGGWSRSGVSPGVAYGSMVEPVDIGSGGGSAGYAGIQGGPGGGAMKLIVSGTLTIDGVLSANGINGGVSEGYSTSQGGGGSGGSIWITTGTLAGAGSITANGGSSLGTYSGIYGGGGGGGRIALYYTSSSFAGTLSANGGTGAANGGAGTIYRKGNSDAHGQVLISNGGIIAGWTPISNYTPYDAVISAGAVVYTPGPVTLSGLAIHSGGYISHKDVIGLGVNLTVLGNATIDAGATIITDGKGYRQQSGPGAGSLVGSCGSGAGYGGAGGWSRSGSSPGATYGSSVEPVDLGSGGGCSSNGSIQGGVGGGVVKLVVFGNLTMDGLISANGTDGWINYCCSDSQGGAGSGGSIWIVAGTLVGSGTITANGGIAPGTWPAGEYCGRFAGGGGGGRIAIYSTNMNGFNPIGISASGGIGYTSGIDGSFYTSTDMPVVSVIPGDASLNGCVDFMDFTLLANHWATGSTPPPPWEDGNFNGDNIVGIDDLLLLVNNWLVGCGASL